MNSEKHLKIKQFVSKRGALSILAIDHRNNLRRSLSPLAPDNVSDQELTEFKIAVVKHLSPEAGFVLIDPQFGAQQILNAGALAGNTGLIVAIEKTGYTGDPNNRVSELLPDWTPEKINQLGACGIKLLVYYHPDSPTADQIEKLVHQVAKDCQGTGIPLFLEPLSYSLDPNKPKLVSSERSRVVIETAKRLTPIPGVDILKAEYPLDISSAPDDAEQIAACRKLSEASAVPWVLLSAGVSFESYLEQLKIACQAGASGAAVGRAVWKEAVDFENAERENFLLEVGSMRMAQVTEICDMYGRPVDSIG